MNTPTNSPEALLRAASGEDAGRGTSPKTPRPAIIPLRWRGHHLDVCAIIREGVTFVARDVLEAIGHSAGGYDADPTHNGPGGLAEHALAGSWDRTTIGDILRPVEDQPLVREFLNWLDEQVAWINEWGIDNLAKVVTTPGEKAPAPAPHEQPRWFSVAATAQILSRDPAISIGQAQLFEWMHVRGWVVKDAGLWTPAKELLTFGHLVVIDNRIRGRKDLYPQVCITPVGLEALHRHLGGIATITLTPTDTPLIEGNHDR